MKGNGIVIETKTKYDHQDLRTIMWLAYARTEINKAGGSADMEKLSKMSLLEFAYICGANHIKLTYDKGCFSS